MSFPSLKSVGGFGASGTGALKRVGDWTLVVVRRVAVGSGAAVAGGCVGTGSVTVGSSVGIGTTVANKVIGGGVGSGGGVGVEAQAVTLSSARNISQRFNSFAFPFPPVN